jgi:hypothetical protein
MSWNIHNLRGSRDTVKAKLSSEKIPESAKAYIIAEIEALPADAIACKVDAFCQDIKSSKLMGITRNSGCTVVGITL